MKKIVKTIGYICITYSAYILISNRQTSGMTDTEVINGAAIIADSNIIEIGCIGLALLLTSKVISLIKK